MLKSKFNVVNGISFNRFVVKQFVNVGPTFFAILAVLKVCSKVVSFGFSNKFSYLIFTFCVCTMKSRGI